MTNRYDTGDSPEGQFQPGSNQKVLLNKLAITEVSVMDDVELELLSQLTEAVLRKVSQDQTITSDDLLGSRCW